MEETQGGNLRDWIYREFTRDSECELHRAATGREIEWRLKETAIDHS